MSKHPRPTVVICGNDILAIGAIKRAKSLGLRVPEDVSVTGFDNIEVSSVVEPELTNVHVPHRKMGTLNAQTLLAISKSGSLVQSHELETVIVERSSLSGPRT